MAKKKYIVSLMSKACDELGSSEVEAEDKWDAIKIRKQHADLNPAYNKRVDDAHSITVTVSQDIDIVHKPKQGKGIYTKACKSIGMSFKQIAVYWLKFKGFSCSEIAEKLDISEDTVNDHIQTARVNLNASNPKDVQRKIAAKIKLLLKLNALKLLKGI
jgi:hypothetical protein